jgi:molybdopterin-binding protein
MRPVEMVVFPLLLLFIANIAVYNDVNQFNVSFKLGSWTFNLGNATSLSLFIGAVGTMVTMTIIAGAKVLESGLSETSIESILKFGIGLTVYAMLAFPVYPYFQSMGSYGNALIIGLTIGYILGLTLNINRGG